MYKSSVIHAMRRAATGFEQSKSVAFSAKVYVNKEAALQNAECIAMVSQLCVHVQQLLINLVLLADLMRDFHSAAGSVSALPLQ